MNNDFIHKGLHSMIKTANHNILRGGELDSSHGQAINEMRENAANHEQAINEIREHTSTIKQAINEMRESLINEELYKETRQLQIYASGNDTYRIMCAYNDIENDRYIVGGSKLYTSDNANVYGNIGVFNNNNWTISTIDASNNIAVIAIFRYMGDYIVLGYSPSTKNIYCYYSADLINWIKYDNELMKPDSLNLEQTRIRYTCSYNKYFYIITENKVFKGTLSTSHDSTITCDLVYSTTTGTIRKIRLLDNMLWLIVTNHVCISNDDGVTWKTIIEDNKREIRDAIFIRNRFIIYAGDNIAYISSDKNVWNEIVLSNVFTSPSGIRHVITYKNIAIMVGISTYCIAISPDGIRWMVLNYIKSGATGPTDTDIYANSSGILCGIGVHHGNMHMAKFNYANIMHLFMVDILKDIC